MKILLSLGHCLGTLVCDSIHSQDLPVRHTPVSFAVHSFYLSTVALVRMRPFSLKLLYIG